MNHTFPMGLFLNALLILLVLAACDVQRDNGEAPSAVIHFERIALVKERRLNEISGIEAGEDQTLVVHNDDGKPDLFILNLAGELLTTLRLENAKNRDWEDITRVPDGDGGWLAVGDIGDNLARRTSLRVYFVRLPLPVAAQPRGGAVTGHEANHVVELTYPDGARDCEAMAYDPVADRILFLTKRDKPPRLYGIDARQALSAESLKLELLGTVPRLRPPGLDDRKRFGKDSALVSQPTGMDINEAGTLAAVITYRSLYLFERVGGQDWAEAFSLQPREFPGPPDRNEEAVAFATDMSGLWIAAEGRPAPIYRAGLPAPRE